MSDWMPRRRAATVNAIKTCESPAEASLLVALLAHTEEPEGYVVGPPGSGARWTLTTQHEVDLPNGRRARLDIAVVRGELRLAIEVDGWLYHHADEDQEARDACRDQALVLAGWKVVRFAAARALEEPVDVVADIAAILHDAEIRSAHSAAAIPEDPLLQRLGEVAGNAAAEDEILREVHRRARIRHGLDKAEEVA